MKPTKKDPPGRPPARKQFRIQKLEERIAPAKGGKGTKNCGASPSDTGPYQSIY